MCLLLFIEHLGQLSLLFLLLALDSLFSSLGSFLFLLSKHLLRLLLFQLKLVVELLLQLILNLAKLHFRFFLMLDVQFS